MKKLENNYLSQNEFDNLIGKYRGKVLNNENEIFKGELPWAELKKYSGDFEYVHFNDLCLSIYEVQSDFKEIISKKIIKT